MSNNYHTHKEHAVTPETPARNSQDEFFLDSAYLFLYKWSGRDFDSLAPKPPTAGQENDSRQFPAPALPAGTL